MIKEAIERVFAMGQAAKPVVPIFDDGTAEHFLVMGKDGWTLEVFDKPLPGRSHTMRTLRGFLDYLMQDFGIPYAATTVARERPVLMEEGADNPPAPVNGIVFVGVNRAVANLNYLEHSTHQVTLNLIPSEEHDALERLIEGVSQRELWRLLISDLKGCIDPGLLLAVGSIKAVQKSDIATEIDVTGISDQKGASSVTITYPALGSKGGTQTAAIPVDWTWKGRIWECFDQEFSINLRLELDTEKGPLVWRFHPERQDRVWREARQALVERLQVDLAGRYLVYEGEQ